MKRAGQGASAGSIVALRYRLGRELPAREFAFTAVADEEAEPDSEAALGNALAGWHEG